MRLVDLDTQVTTWNYDFYKEEYVAVQTTVGEMIDFNTHEGLSIPIIEIPEPHGDLIDRDKLRAKEFIHDGDAYAVVMSRDIRNAPTVIPASKEGE